MRHAIEFFARKMERKLRRDDKVKPDWHEQSVDELRSNLRSEVYELLGALEVGTPEQVHLEAADVALTAMMLADKIKPFSDNRGELPAATLMARVEAQEARFDE